MDTGHSTTTGTGNVFLGYQAGRNETGSNTLYIANTDTTFPLIYGEFDTATLGINASVGIGIQNPGYPLEMASGAYVTAGGVWTDASSRNYKDDIKALSSSRP